MTTALPSPGELLECMTRALEARHFDDAVALLRVLAVADPASALVICEAIEALPAWHGAKVDA